MPDENAARAEAKTLPPTTVAMPAPAGRVLWREVHDEHGAAGVVWIAARGDSRSRAGLVVARRPDGPSVPFQRQLAEVVLTATSSDDAAEWLDSLYVEPPLTFGPSGDAESVDELRAAWRT